jgi:hypothetical protein
MQIDKGIPIPRAYEHTRTGLSSILTKMEVGDSFFSPQDQRTVTPKVWTWAKAHGVKFTSRREGTGTRIWRIA